MGWLRKKAKQIGKAFKKVGKALKKGLGKLAKAFGKLGPLGSLALSFIIPGVGGQIFQWLKDIPYLGKVFQGIAKVGNFVKEGVGTIFNKVTDGIEYALNKVSQPFIKEGARGAGSALRDWVSETTNGFIKPSEQGNIFDKDLALKTSDGKLVSELTGDELDVLKSTGELDKIKASADLGRSQSAFIGDNVRNVESMVDADGKTIELAKGEVYQYNEATKQHQIWKNQEAYSDYASGKYDSAVGGLTPDDIVTATPKPSILEGRQEGKGITESFKGSREGAAYAKLAPVQQLGSAMQAEEDAIAQFNADQKSRKSAYFSDQADYQLAPLEQQNYSRSADQPQFVNFADFNPSEDPAQQYLAYRGIQGNVNPVDVGGYGFDYEAFLRAQLGDRAYG
tara:strand:- start:6 stop:1190 length:1185 start_codon:yes stop_codon:yes gene_type:complete